MWMKYRPRLDKKLDVAYFKVIVRTSAIGATLVVLISAWTMNASIANNHNERTGKLTEQCQLLNRHRNTTGDGNL